MRLQIEILRPDGSKLVREFSYIPDLDETIKDCRSITITNIDIVDPYAESAPSCKACGRNEQSPGGICGRCAMEGMR